MATSQTFDWIVIPTSGGARLTFFTFINIVFYLVTNHVNAVRQEIPKSQRTLIRKTAAGSIVIAVTALAVSLNSNNRETYWSIAAQLLVAYCLSRIGMLILHETISPTKTDTPTYYSIVLTICAVLMAYNDTLQVSPVLPLGFHHFMDIVRASNKANSFLTVGSLGISAATYALIGNVQMTPSQRSAAMCTTPLMELVMFVSVLVFATEPAQTLLSNIPSQSSTE